MVTARLVGGGVEGSNLMKLTAMTVLKKWHRAELAYQRDCNSRLLKKPDRKRRELRDKESRLFEQFMKLMKSQLEQFDRGT